MSSVYCTVYDPEDSLCFINYQYVNGSVTVMAFFEGEYGWLQKVFGHIFALKYKIKWCLFYRPHKLQWKGTSFKKVFQTSSK